MTTYQILAPHFVAGLVVDHCGVTSSAPILNWAVGKDWETVLAYFERKGWEVVPVIPGEDQPCRPTQIQYGGDTYDFHWEGNTLTRITLNHTKDLAWNDVPIPVRRTVIQ